MLDVISKIWPILLAVVLYVVRLEVTMAKITRDLCWIKKAISEKT